MSKIRMTKYLSATLILVGGAFLATFYFSESFVDPDGILHEPFGLLVVGYLLLLAGAIAGLVAYRRKSGNPEPPI